MTTLDTEPGLKRQTDVESPPVPSVEPAPETSALITEEQVMFSSAAALAPAPSRRWSHAAHEVAAIGARDVRQAREAACTTPDYPQRFGYLENSLVAREMSGECDPRHSPDQVSLGHKAMHVRTPRIRSGHRPARRSAGAPYPQSWAQRWGTSDR